MNALETARGLWQQTHPKSAANDAAMPAPPHDETNPIVPVGPPMSSFKQIEADRRNALKSTAPTTPERKRRSRARHVQGASTARQQTSNELCPESGILMGGAQRDCSGARCITNAPNP